MKHRIIALSLLLALAGCSAPIYHPTPSPDGEFEARLTRSVGKMAPIFYWVKITGPGQPGNGCVAAQLVGLQAQNYVRFDWTGPRALNIRYGLSPDDSEREGVPRPHSGEEACRGFTVTFTEDPALRAAAEEANHNRLNVPAYQDEADNMAEPLSDGAAPANTSLAAPPLQNRAAN